MFQLLIKSTVPLLSISISIDKFAFNSSDLKTLLTYSMYYVQETSAINYDSVTDRATIFCIELFSEIGAPSR